MFAFLKRSTSYAITLSLVSLACIGVIDVASGQLMVVLLYFLPIGIAAWFVGRKAGIALCFPAVSLWLIDYLKYDYRGWGSASWDTAITLGVFVCFSLSLSALRLAKDNLEKFAAGLEAKVQERTQELRNSNAMLLRAQEGLQRANAALERRAEQLRNLTNELTRTEERERYRIAQILHDNLQQLLVAAKFSLDALSRQTTETVDRRAELDHIAGLIDESITASRSLTAELAPPPLYTDGLAEALRWLAGWMEEKHGLSVGINADEKPDHLDPEMRVILFRAIRELLFNVVKHAQVRHATVVLCYGRSGILSARVRDEGVGFDPTKEPVSTTGGFGLFSIGERLAAIGGRLIVESAPGHGTTSTIYVPVRFPKAVNF